MSRAGFVELPRLLVFSPLALAMVDDFTSGDPIGFVQSTLEFPSTVPDPTDPTKTITVWSDTGIRGLVTPSGFLTYPNLGRSGNLTPPKRDYRVTVATQYYVPYYEPWPTVGGFPFTVSPYTGDDPTTLVPVRGTLRLLPAPNYPFPASMPILRGVVRKGSGSNPPPVPNALVESDESLDTTPVVKKTSLALADGGGRFRIPLRWGGAKVPTSITVTDPKTQQTFMVSVTFPDDLRTPKTITIPGP